MFYMKKLITFIIYPRDAHISREIIVLALPVIISNLSRVIMGIVDIAMVGHLGAHALAAVGMGSILVWTFISAGISLRTATQTLSSRRLGQKNYSECGTALRNGHVMALIAGSVISYFGWKYSTEIASLFMKDPQVLPQCIEYTSYGFLSVYFLMASFVFQGFFTGVEKTAVHMKVTIASNMINVYLNAGLIFGSETLNVFFQSLPSPISGLSFLWSWYDFPELGVKGAAIATLISSMWMLAHYTIYIFNREIRKKFKILNLHFDMEMMVRQVKLAVPQGLQEILVTGGFAVFYRILGIIGTLELATTEIVFTIMHASFMPAIGVGQACATLVGKYLGENKPHIAEGVIWDSVRWALWIMGSMGMIFILIPYLIIPFFTSDLGIISYGTNALRIVGLLQFADAVAITLWFALSGAGNTIFPGMVDGLLCWLIFLPGSYYFGVIMGMGFWGPWSFLCIYLTLFAIIMVWKIRQGSWKQIEV